MSDIWNLNSICRCCHIDGNFRAFILPNNYNGKLESYRDLLQKTFNISMSIPEGVNVSNMICEDCISSLKDAAKFKDQVQACESKFQQYVKNEFFTLASDVQDSFAQDVKIENVVDVANVKVEVEYHSDPGVKIEKTSNSEFEDDDLPYRDNKYEENVTTDKSDIKADIKPLEKINKADKGKRVKKIGIDKCLVKNITCHICIENLNEKQLLKHIETHRRPYNCKFCEQKFDKYDNISIHVQKKHSNEMYTCNFCKQTFKTRAKLSHHLDRHTRQKSFECDICQKKLKDRCTMIRHSKTHDPRRMDKRFECPKCFWKFTSNTNLITHIQTVHEHIRNYHCTRCWKSFAAKKNLAIHFKIHTDQHPYKCNICPKKFRVLNYLNKHKKVHSKDPDPIIKSYNCSTCNLKFDHRGIYIDHLKTHPDKALICDQCGIILICEKSLLRHKRSHNPLQFVCDYCDKIFKTKLQLVRHIKRFHLKIIEKLKCKICGKLVVDLKQHQLIHYQKRFACTLCPRKYAERRQLKRHLRDNHSGSKLYGCEICGKRYMNKKGMNNHLNKCRIKEKKINK